MGCRLPPDPRIIVTGTPKPSPLINQLLEASRQEFGLPMAMDVFRASTLLKDLAAEAGSAEQHYTAGRCDGLPPYIRRR